MILWSLSSQSDYGKLNAGQSGPIIDNQQPKPGEMPNGSKKYGAELKGYGKPVYEYGKPNRYN